MLPNTITQPLDDYLLPDAQTIRDFMFDEPEELLAEPSHEDEEGVFSDEPEHAASWVEHASHHFINF